MKNSNYKDFKKRNVIKRCEFILLQTKLSCRLDRQFLERWKIDTHDLQIKNRCILTARSKGICSDFKLSRIKTRELGSNCLINGLKRVSW